jgi:hypothetical protein
LNQSLVRRVFLDALVVCVVVHYHHLQKATFEPTNPQIIVPSDGGPYK